MSGIGETRVVKSNLVIKKGKGQSLSEDESYNNIRDMYFVTLLQEAISISNMDAVKSLLHGGSCNITEQTSGLLTTVLHVAMINNKHTLELIDLLLADEQHKQQLLYMKDAGGLTAMHYAIDFNKQDAITKLIEKGYNKDYKDINGETLLHYAVKQNKLKAVEALVDAGCSLKVKDGNNYTALDYAQENLHNLKKSEELNRYKTTQEQIVQTLQRGRLNEIPSDLTSTLAVSKFTTPKSPHSKLRVPYRPLPKGKVPSRDQYSSNSTTTTTSTTTTATSTTRTSVPTYASNIGKEAGAKIAERIALFEGLSNNGTQSQTPSRAIVTKYGKDKNDIVTIKETKKGSTKWAKKHLKDGNKNSQKSYSPPGF